MIDYKLLVVYNDAKLGASQHEDDQTVMSLDPFSVIRRNIVI